jgi:hypothetical protein
VPGAVGAGAEGAAGAAEFCCARAVQLIESAAIIIKVPVDFFILLLVQ